MKLLREPLVHFLALGVVLYLISGLVGDSAGEREDSILVGAGQIRQLEETFARTWQRPPTVQELDGLIEEHIREEVYYREALAMGLERDDTIIRRRLRQKLEPDPSKPHYLLTQPGTGYMLYQPDEDKV